MKDKDRNKNLILKHLRNESQINSHNNNSSVLTTEHSSLIHNKSKIPKTRGIKLIDKKFLSTSILNRPSPILNPTATYFQSALPKTNLSNHTNDLYLTGFKSPQSKKIISGEDSYFSRSSKKNTFLINVPKTENRSFNNNKKNLLPQIIDVKQKNIEEIIMDQSYFNCCDLKLKTKHLNQLYLTQLKEKADEKPRSNSRNIKKINHKKEKLVVRDGAKKYIEKTNEINRLHYFFNLKNEAITEYKENLRKQLTNLDLTINKINTYKYNLEYKIPAIQNKQFNKLYGKLLLEKLEEDKQKQTLQNLNNEIDEIQSLIDKKESFKKIMTNWLILLLTLQNGHKYSPKDMQQALKDSKQKLIFENVDDMFFCFKQKENKNLRLMEKLEEENLKKQKMLKELKNLQNVEKNFIKRNYETIIDNEKKLYDLKIENSKLSDKLNEIIINNKKNKENNGSSKKIKNKRNFNDISGSILETGNCSSKEVFDLINKIYRNIVNYAFSSNLEQINFVDIENKIRNTNYSITQKAIMQLTLMESSIDYFVGYIINKSQNEKNMEIIKKAKQQIELDHKKQKIEKYKTDVVIKTENLIKKIEIKNKKVNNLPGKKCEKDFVYLFMEKRKKTENSKKKKNNRKLNIMDFLYDEFEQKNDSDKKKENSSESVLEKK